LHRYRTNYLFDPDPMGNFHFSVDEETKQITARLTTPNGDEVLWEMVHADPFALVHQIVELMPGLDVHHQIYLGSEARKLLIALRSGGEYVQD
jgi:dihydropteroate synthase